MGTYYIPRNYRGETRFLYIFTIKSLISSAIGAGFGVIFFLIFRAMDMTAVGLIIMAFFGLIGYIIGAVKIPTIVAIPITKKIGGEPIYEIALRYAKFKQKRKLYIYTKDYSKEEIKNG